MTKSEIIKSVTYYKIYNDYGNSRPPFIFLYSFYKTDRFIYLAKVKERHSETVKRLNNAQ